VGDDGLGEPGPLRERDMTLGTEFDEAGRIEANIPFGSCWQLMEWIYQMFCRV
jgi:hypothetical protein